MTFCGILFCASESRKLEKITNTVPCFFLILCHNFTLFLIFLQLLQTSHWWSKSSVNLKWWSDSDNLNLVSGHFLANWKMSHYRSLSKDSLYWIASYAVLSSKYWGNEDIWRMKKAFGWSKIEMGCGIQETNVGHSVWDFKPHSHVWILSRESEIRQKTAQILWQNQPKELGNTISEVIDKFSRYGSLFSFFNGGLE